jgi:hypothetical protein
MAAARAFLLESDHVMLLSAHQIHYEMQAGLLVALPHPAGDQDVPAEAPHLGAHAEVAMHTGGDGIRRGRRLRIRGAVLR